MEGMQSKCKWCHQNILSQDEIIYCPICATPYHKTCWENNGGCAQSGCAGQAAKNPAVTSPQTEEGSKEPQVVSVSPEQDTQAAQTASSQAGTEAQVPVETPPQDCCANCGAQIAPGQNFCDKCGAPRQPSVDKCPRCGAEIHHGHAFCDRCGAPCLSPQPQKCPNCAEPIQPGQAFCPKCGQKVPVATIAPQPMPGYSHGAPQKNARKKKKKIMAAIIAGVSVLSVCLIAVIVIVIVSVTSGGSQDFNKMYGNIALNDWCDIAEDGSWIAIDTNPLDIDDYNDMAAYYAIQEINNDLGFPDSLWQKMESSSALNGQQSDTTDKYEVTWFYHPDRGMEVLYSVIK